MLDEGPKVQIFQREGPKKFSKTRWNCYNFEEPLLSQRFGPVASQADQADRGARPSQGTWADVDSLWNANMPTVAQETTHIHKFSPEE